MYTPIYTDYTNCSAYPPRTSIVSLIHGSGRTSRRRGVNTAPRYKYLHVQSKHKAQGTSATSAQTTQAYRRAGAGNPSHLSQRDTSRPGHPVRRLHCHDPQDHHGQAARRQVTRGINMNVGHGARHYPHGVRHTAHWAMAEPWPYAHLRHGQHGGKTDPSTVPCPAAILPSPNQALMPPSS